MLQALMQGRAHLRKPAFRMLAAGSKRKTKGTGETVAEGVEGEEDKKGLAEMASFDQRFDAC